MSILNLIKDIQNIQDQNVLLDIISKSTERIKQLQNLKIEKNSISKENIIMSIKDDKTDAEKFEIFLLLEDIEKTGYGMSPYYLEDVYLKKWDIERFNFYIKAQFNQNNNNFIQSIDTSQTDKINIHLNLEYLNRFYTKKPLFGEGFIKLFLYRKKLSIRLGNALIYDINSDEVKISNINEYLPKDFYIIKYL